MAYCSASDVAATLRHVPITATSVPTTTEVGTMCTDVSAEMDALMQSVGIVVPVTLSSKTTMLRDIAVNGVAARIFRALQGKPELADQRQKLYDAAMRNIMDHPSIIGVSQGSGGYPTGSSAQTTRPFRRDEQDW